MNATLKRSQITQRMYLDMQQINLPPPSYKVIQLCYISLQKGGKHHRECPSKFITPIKTAI